MGGFLIVILGSLCLAAQNVLLRVLFSSELPLALDAPPVPATPANALLMLQLRSWLILPAIAILSFRLYPATGRELRAMAASPKLAVQALGGSASLFLAMALLFFAIATIPAGVATVLFFIHPAITGLLSWKVFGSRPSRLRGAVTVGVLLGALLVAPAVSGSLGAFGVTAALVASVCYSVQGILAQICFRHIHPLPFTLVNFAVLAVLATLGLALMRIDIPAAAWPVVWRIAIATAVLTLLGQLFYNIGINLVRAASMAIVAVSNPVFTVIIAWLLLNESLQPRQLLGVALVVLSILALSRDRPTADASG